MLSTINGFSIGWLVGALIATVLMPSFTFRHVDYFFLGVAVVSTLTIFTGDKR